MAIASRVTRVLAAAASMLLFAGCSPAVAGFVTTEGTSYTLRVPSQCRFGITDVVVKYYDEDSTAGFDQLTTAWSAHAEAGASAREIALFQSNPGFTEDSGTEPIDTTEKMVIWWSEHWPDGDDLEGSLVGTLGDLTGDEVLWAGGIAKAEQFGAELSSPIGRFRC